MFDIGIFFGYNNEKGESGLSVTLSPVAEQDRHVQIQVTPSGVN